MEQYNAMLSRFSHVQLSATLWTVAHQAPLSMGFSSQEYWSGFPFSPPGDLSDSGIEPVSTVSPTLQADSLPAEHQGIHLFLSLLLPPDQKVATGSSKPTLSSWVMKLEEKTASLLNVSG